MIIESYISLLKIWSTLKSRRKIKSHENWNATILAKN